MLTYYFFYMSALESITAIATIAELSKVKQGEKTCLYNRSITTPMDVKFCYFILRTFNNKMCLQHSMSQMVTKSQ